MSRLWNRQKISPITLLLGIIPGSMGTSSFIVEGDTVIASESDLVRPQVKLSPLA
jgi:hypothetical protein